MVISRIMLFRQNLTQHRKSATRIIYYSLHFIQNNYSLEYRYLNYIFRPEKFGLFFLTTDNNRVNNFNMCDKPVMILLDKKELLPSKIVISRNHLVVGLPFSTKALL